MGETTDEVRSTLADLAGIGVDIVTIGQYLRPTSHHLPVARWWEPAEFAALAEAGEAMGIGHVEASPLTRSSYHARQAAAAATPATLAAREVPA
jgi:lipoic acid synthetase